MLIIAYDIPEIYLLFKTVQENISVVDDLVVRQVISTQTHAN